MKPFLEHSPNIFSRRPVYKKGRLFATCVGINFDSDEFPVTVESAVEAAKQIVTEQRAAYLAYKTPVMQMHDYLSLRDILLSPQSYSGNLSEPSKLSAALTKIARIDRLPNGNSLGGLNALRFAWDAVDICNHEADKMKAITKISYMVLLSFGLIISTLSVVYLNRPDSLDRGTLNHLTAGLALVSGIISGIITTINPVSSLRLHLNISASETLTDIFDLLLTFYRVILPSRSLCTSSLSH